MVQCRHSGICCFGIKSRVALDRDKNGMLIMCTLIHARASTGGSQAQMPTIESRSMNGRGQVLWWWQIWLLSTSAFLNTRSYLPSPLEERSFLFYLSPPLSPSSFPLSLFSAQPSLQTHLSSSHLSLYTSLAHFPVFFFQESLVDYFHFQSTLSLTIPSFLFYSQWNSPFSNKTKLPRASHAA